MKVRSVRSLYAAGALLAGALVAVVPVVATPAAAGGVTLTTGSVTFPSNVPRCPEHAPEGWEFVESVQPPWGIAYDLYRKQQPDGSYIYRQVYCF